MKKFYDACRIALLLLLFNVTANAQSNQYLDFDGVDDYTTLPEAAQYVNNLNTITMAGWFYTNALGYGQGMMSLRGGGSGDGQMYVLQLDNGKLECRVVTSTGLHEVATAEGVVQAGQWQHIAWVMDATQVRLYVNGVLTGTGTSSGTFQSPDRPLTLGKSVLSGTNFVYNGRIDEFSLWSKALSQTEIQNMMSNELVGDEADLEVYYKFNQGEPGSNNTAITQLINEGSNTDRNSSFVNFALNGATSNFNGTLDSDFQVINFPPVADKLVTDAPFTLNATTNSGLPITYEVTAGPATVSGNTITLTGTSGEVTVKASQAGNGSYQPASDVYVSFNALDPAEVLVEAQVLHPLAGNVYIQTLSPLPIAVQASIDHEELFNIAAVTVNIDGESVTLTDYSNGYYTGYWTPSSFGTHTIELIGANNYGNNATVTESFNLVNSATSQVVTATNQVWVSADYPTQTVEADLPSFIGRYNQIIGTLSIDCPNGGCDPWDRVSSVEVQGKDGEWYEIIRYLTPYGVACQSTINLTDFKSLLKGKTKFRVNLATQGNGFLYTLNLSYQTGFDTAPYSSVQKLWYQTYQFGDMANLQPTENFNIEYPANTTAAKIKLVSSGHGWGTNNTSNAAEFSNNTHHINVNGLQTFTQNNWNTCNPNPDGCSPQYGTWYYNRAGWCPGSIAQFFDFSMTPYVNQPSTSIDYVFDQNYVDYCHPNNPNCITGSTCADCNDSFNPHLIVSSYLISFGASPLLATEEMQERNSTISVYPNPSTGIFYITAEANQPLENITIYDLQGRMVKELDVMSGNTTTQVNISEQAAGIYLVTMTDTNGNSTTRRVVKE